MPGPSTLHRNYFLFSTILNQTFFHKQIGIATTLKGINRVDVYLESIKRSICIIMYVGNAVVGSYMYSAAAGGAISQG